MQNGTVKTPDGAHIYYEVEGEGRPIVLIHGWSCHGRFYEKNVAGLKDKFKMVTIDLRGHGRSSKGLDGYTLDQLARDIHQVIEHLALEDVFLLGWSMGGPTVLSYFKQFGKYRGHLAGLGLIDMTPYPFSSGEWNSHGLKGYNLEGLNGFAKSLYYEHDKFVNGFAAKMFPEIKVPDGEEWVVTECGKLLPHIGIALYSDYCYSDFTDVLPKIDVPTLVLCANSGVFPDSERQGEWIRSQIPDAELVTFKKGGHLLFWVEAEKFNRALEDHSRKIW